MWNQFARPRGKPWRAVLYSKPPPDELAAACSVVGEAAGEIVEVLDDEHAWALVQIAANEDALRVLRHGRAKRLLWENT